MRVHASRARDWVGEATKLLALAESEPVVKEVIQETHNSFIATVEAAHLHPTVNRGESFK